MSSHVMFSHVLCGGITDVVIKMSPFSVRVYMSIAHFLSHYHNVMSVTSTIALMLSVFVVPILNKVFFIFIFFILYVYNVHPMPGWDLHAEKCEYQ